MADWQTLTPLDEGRRLKNYGWGILEVMGHVILGGRISECQIADGVGIRIIVPVGTEGEEWVTDYAASAIFSITPTTEEVARKVAERNVPPVWWQYARVAPTPPQSNMLADFYGQSGDDDRTPDGEVPF